MVKTLKDKHGFIRPATIKVVGSTLIAKKLASMISVDPNIFNDNFG
jgi:hypothetical protein